MSKLLKTMLMTPSGGASVVPCPDDENILSPIFSAYNLCVSGTEAMVVSMASTYSLCVPDSESLVISVASAYSLAVA